MNNKSMEWQQTLGGVNPTLFSPPTSRQEFRRGRAGVVFVSFGSFVDRKRILKVTRADSSEVLST